MLKKAVFIATITASTLPAFAASGSIPLVLRDGETADISAQISCPPGNRIELDSSSGGTTDRIKIWGTCKPLHCVVYKNRTYGRIFDTHRYSVYVEAGSNAQGKGTNPADNDPFLKDENGRSLRGPLKLEADKLVRDAAIGLANNLIKAGRCTTWISGSEPPPSI